MVVAAADFYRYSEATGTPLPKSKKEEAQLAPAVNQWKKSRTSRNQNENNSNLGTAAAATAALAGIGATVLGLSRGKRPDTSIIEDSWSKIRNSIKAPDTATSTAVGGIKKDLNKKLSDIVEPFEGPDEPYVDPRRIDKKESYRYSEGQKQADATTANLTPAQIEEDAQTILRTAEGEIPPGMQTPEQQAVFSPLSYIEDKGYVQPTTAVEVAKLDDVNVSQQAIENTNLNINAASNAGPQVGLDPEVTKVAKSQLTQADINAINNVGITGTRIAGPSNVQTVKPYGTRTSGNNQTLTRQEPIINVETELPEQTFLKSQIEQRLDKLQEETTKLQAIGQNLERAGQLMEGGTQAVNTPGSTTFDNAMAAGMVARAGIKPRITNQYYQKNISLPKTMREVVDTGEIDPGRIIDTEPKGGGGRKVTAYNPDYQQLSTVGSYGIERANYPRADITKRPTEMPISPRTGKETQSWSTRPSSSPEVAKQAMEISENIRKIYNSGRPDAQQLVEDYKRSLGWSPN